MAQTEQDILDEKTYGQVAYEAYAKHLNIVLPWDGLQVDIQKAWNMAGNASYDKVPKKDKLTDDNVA